MEVHLGWCSRFRVRLRLLLAVVVSPSSPSPAAPVPPAGETIRLIVLFGGGTKRGQKRDIDRAKQLFAEYKARKKALNRKAVGSKGKR